MTEFTLEMVFEMEASSKYGVINSQQLQNILVMERQRRFDKLLVNELVNEFGSNGFVSFAQFRKIWLYLGQIRAPFETYATKGVLSKKKFARFLTDQLDCFIHKITINSLLAFYKNQLTFDVCVHALKYLSQLQLEYCLQTQYITFDGYRQLVRGTPTLQLSTPFDDAPPSYEEAIGL